MTIFLSVLNRCVFSHGSRSPCLGMSAIERCRTAALGGHVAQCEDCSHTQISYNSCRNRHCPKCQGAAARDWLAAREAELLPVGYFHIVFTLPAAVAEGATAETSEAPFEERFLVLARAIRSWALDNPHLYALLYGSPVPGYAAPEDTIEPAGRIVAAFVALLDGDPAPAARNSETFDLIRAGLGTEIDDDALARGIAAWTQLFGHISFELFGQFNNAVGDYDAFFERTMRIAATTASSNATL